MPTHLERTDELLELSHLRRQLATGLLSLTGAFGRALASLVDLHDILVDVVRHGRLFFGRGGDLLVLVDDHAHRTEDILQRLLHLGRLADSAIGGLVGALNGALIAWFNAWRILNLIGFVGTFTLASLWADQYYSNDQYAPVQAFLILFFLLFTAIGVFFARRTLLDAKTADRKSVV